MLGFIIGVLFLYFVMYKKIFSVNYKKVTGEK